MHSRNKGMGFPEKSGSEKEEAGLSQSTIEISPSFLHAAWSVLSPFAMMKSTPSNPRDV